MREIAYHENIAILQNSEFLQHIDAAKQFQNSSEV